MKNLSVIRAKLEFLASLNPGAWDAVHPNTPFLFSNAHVDLLVADVVKHVGSALSDKGLAKTTLELSRKMATAASAGLIEAWEPGDELCPPWRWPVPGPVPPVAGPQPEPWQPIATAEQLDLAQSLSHLSGLTSNEEFHESLKSLATATARSVAGHLVDDFERCGTKPRRPFPPRRY